MTAPEIIGLTITLCVMLAGFIGSFVPLLPHTSCAFAIRGAEESSR